jgi:hypothetical protein
MCSVRVGKASDVPASCTTFTIASSTSWRQSVVTRRDGHTRAIFFEKGMAVNADLSQADGNMNFRATKEADLFKIDAGNERYEIPEAAVFGG